MDRSRWRCALVAPAALLLAAAAQGSGQGSGPPGMSRGVIVPPRHVDPGMKVMAPRMPRQSTPVVAPQRLHPDGGAVVVPR